MDKWQPIDTAPRDGTLLLLLVTADDDNWTPTDDCRQYRTIGANNCDNTGDDEWLFAGWDWQQDEFTQGRGTPTHWLRMPASPVKDAP